MSIYKRKTSRETLTYSDASLIVVEAIHQNLNNNEQLIAKLYSLMLGEDIFWNEEDKLFVKQQYIIRQYDWFDGWLDETSPLTKKDADVELARLTNNGTEKTQSTRLTGQDSYYDIFRANTRMLQSSDVVDT